MIDRSGNEYCYLNPSANTVAASADHPPMRSRLAEHLADTRQAKAPPAQWQAMLRGFTQKGVKQTEIDESRVLGWLQSQQDSGVASITAQELRQQVHRGLPTVKETILAQPCYQGYRTHKEAHSRGPRPQSPDQDHNRYTETLYSLNSQRDDVVDELQEIEAMVEEMQLNAGGLAFDLTRLMDDPELLSTPDHISSIPPE